MAFSFLFSCGSFSKQDLEKVVQQAQKQYEADEKKKSKKPSKEASLDQESKSSEGGTESVWVYERKFFELSSEKGDSARVKQAVWVKQNRGKSVFGEGDIISINNQLRTFSGLSVTTLEISKDKKIHGSSKQEVAVLANGEESDYEDFQVGDKVQFKGVIDAAENAVKLIVSVDRADIERMVSE